MMVMSLLSGNNTFQVSLMFCLSDTIIVHLPTGKNSIVSINVLTFMTFQYSVPEMILLAKHSLIPSDNKG